MVGHRFLELSAERAAAGRPRRSTSRSSARSRAWPTIASACRSSSTARRPKSCRWPAAGQYEAAGFAVRLATRAPPHRPRAAVVSSRSTAAPGEVPYDRLVLATGSSPFVPPIPGRDLPGCFVYRTIEDLEAIRAWAASHAGRHRRGDRRRPARPRGRLRALQKLGMKVHVVEFAPRLMALQLDDDGRRRAAQAHRGAGRRRAHRDRRPRRSSPATTAARAALRFADGERAGGRRWWSSRPASARATSWRAPPA